MEFAQREEDLSCAPTPLHEVGTWKKPPSPSSSSKVRLMDSAIHVFAATFGLQDGHQQEKVVRMLETLIASTVEIKAVKPLVPLLSFFVRISLKMQLTQMQLQRYSCVSRLYHFTKAQMTILLEWPLLG